MKHFLKLSCPLWLLFLAVPAVAKSWENVFPLKTTRAEVLDLFGNPKINPKDKGEHFVFGEQTLTFRWAQANCSGENVVIDEKSAKPDSLVYQITVVPTEPLKSIDSYTSGESKTFEPVPGRYFSSYLTHCFGNTCSYVNTVDGFGYSKSDRGFTALYFSPSEAEEKVWKKKHAPCLPMEK